MEGISTAAVDRLDRPARPARPAGLKLATTTAILVAAGVALACGLVVAFWVAPTDASTLGFSQKIFYFHAPIAETALLAYGVAFVAAVLYLRREDAKYDRLGVAAHLPAFLALIVLADVGIATLGTLVATISMNTRARDLLLPILFLPLAIPLLIAAASGTSTVFSGAAGGGSLFARLAFLLVYDGVFLVLAYGTYDFAIGE